MSYSEDGNEVVLRMSWEDWKELDSCMRLVRIFEAHCLPRFPSRAAGLRDRVNSGNPNYTPYQVEEKKS